MSKVSVVIPTFNNWQYTKRCLESIKDNTSRDSLKEVIIVDNGSTDGTLGELRSYDVVLVSNGKNHGFARACNQGAKKSRGRFVVFLNNDTEVKKGWLEPLLSEIKKEKIGIATPKLIYPNGLIQHIGKVFDESKNHHLLYRNFSQDKEQVSKKREFQAVIAASIIIEKRLFERVGGFDEAYLNGGEDNDLCFKVRELGYKIMYVPNSVVVHHESVSVNKQKNEKKLFQKNRKIFHQRWEEKIKPDLEKIYEEDGFLDIFTKQKNQLKKQQDWILHLEKDNKELRVVLNSDQSFIIRITRRIKRFFSE